MNVIDESYRVGMMLAKTPEGRTYMEKKEIADSCLREVFGELAQAMTSHRNSFFEYEVLNDCLQYECKQQGERQIPFIKEGQIETLLGNKDWCEAVAYTGKFAVHVEKMLEQIQFRGSFKDISGFTMTPKLRNAGMGLETAYQRTGLYDIGLLQKIAWDKSYGEQLKTYEERRRGIGGNVSHDAYCREARRLMREMERQGYEASVIHMSENLYLLKDLMEEAIYESFFGGRITIETELIRKVRIKELGKGFGMIALWSEWSPKLLTARERFIYDVILEDVRRNCAMRDIRFHWNRDGNCYIRMLGLLYPKSDVGVFQMT